MQFLVQFINFYILFSNTKPIPDFTAEVIKSIIRNNTYYPNNHAHPPSTPRKDTPYYNIDLVLRLSFPSLLPCQGIDNTLSNLIMSYADHLFKVESYIEWY